MAGLVDVDLFVCLFCLFVFRAFFFVGGGGEREREIKEVRANEQREGSHVSAAVSRCEGARSSETRSEGSTAAAGEGREAEVEEEVSFEKKKHQDSSTLFLSFFLYLFLSSLTTCWSSGRMNPLISCVNSHAAMSEERTVTGREEEKGVEELR